MLQERFRRNLYKQKIILLLTSWCRSEKSCSLVFPWLCWPQHSPFTAGATAAPLDKFHILRSIDRPRLVLLELKSTSLWISPCDVCPFPLTLTFSKRIHLFTLCQSFSFFFVPDLGKMFERLMEDMEITRATLKIPLMKNMR